MKTRNNLHGAFAVSAAAVLLLSCSDEYYEAKPGPHGEPAEGLSHSYSGTFKVPKGKYFVVLNEFYSFSDRHSFEEVRFEPCFGDVLRFGFEERRLPCISWYSLKGAPLKAQLIFTIREKSFNRLDHHDYLSYSIDLYVHGTFGPVTGLQNNLKNEVEPVLRVLSAEVETVIAPQLPDNNALQPTREDARG